MMVTYSYTVGNSTSVPSAIFRVGFISFLLILNAVVCWVISDALTAVPVENRKRISPGLVWLLMIPIFNLVWNFFVFSRVSDSFQSCFESCGRPQPGDYGKSLGLAYCLTTACSLIPCLGCLSGLAALVLLILTLIKFSQYKRLIIHGGGGAFPL